MSGTMRAVLAAVLLWPGVRPRADEVRLATYNLQNYGVERVGRKAKSLASREAIQRALVSVRPDILAVQEVCGPAALEDLQSALKRGGVNLTYAQLVAGGDTNIQIAVLSRFPVTRAKFHTNDVFLLDGRRHKVERGFGEFEFQISGRFRLAVLMAHLKSRRASLMVDEAEERLAEATLLREKVDAQIRVQPDARLVVLGDFNDVPGSAPVRKLIGRGKTRLVDVRPEEQCVGMPPRASSGVAWTHYYAQDDTYSRLDYILVTPSLAGLLDPAGSYVLAMPDWQVGSDHRPVVVTLRTDP